MLGLSLNLLIPSFVALSCILFALIRMLATLRKRFPYKVNCWFCSANTRVSYNNLNSFNCPNCLQFNGFTDDGNYNREIPEQHYSKLNTSSYCQRTDRRQSTHNGLCDPCNRNQEMKIIQLANFKARCDARYDEEIEEYRQKLEDSYQLCQQCNRNLNKTLNRVKTKLIGSKMSQLVAKGLTAVSPVKTTKNDKQITSKLVMLSIFSLSIVNLLKEANVDLKFLRSITHESLLNAYYVAVALVLTVFDLFKNLTNGIDFDVTSDKVAIAAVILNASILLSQTRVRTQIIASILFWSLKMLSDELTNEIPSYYCPAVKGSIAASLVLISLLMLYKSRNVKPALVEHNGSFHKIHSDVADDSDAENDISSDTSNFDVRSTRSSIYPPASTYYNSFRDQTILRPAKTFSPLSTTFTDRSMLNSTMGRQSVATIDLLSNKSFSIRREVAEADRTQVHKDITKLNISGSLLGSTSTLKDFSMAKSLNPFSLENSRCGSPTLSIASVFSGSNRTQIVTPPRLESTIHCEAQSWVGGGYWSSPQKRFLEAHPENLRMNQKMSRSSSQSSGLGTIDSDRNSREDEMFSEPSPSIFTEPVRRRNLFDRPPETRSLYSQSFVQPPKANNFFLSSGSANNFRKYRDGNASFFK